MSVIGGQSDAHDRLSTAAAAPQVKAGKLRGLAVTASTRLDDLPEVPTTDEAGYPDVHVQLWSGCFAPAKTRPGGRICQVEAELRRIMGLPDVKEKFRAMATGTVGSSSPPNAAKLIDAETKMTADVAKAANLKFEQ